MKTNDVKIQKHNANNYEAIVSAGVFAPGIWVTYKTGDRERADHYSGESVTPATADRYDVYKGLQKLAMFIRDEKTLELQLRELNPDIRSMIGGPKFSEMFIITADGTSIKAYDRDQSSWDNTGYFPSNNTLKKSRKEQKYDAVKAVNATLTLFGYEKEVRRAVTEAEKAEKVAEKARIAEEKRLEKERKAAEKAGQEVPKAA